MCGFCGVYNVWNGYAANTPSSSKVRLFQSKRLFKRACKDFLPAPILTRKKIGCNILIATWFREG